MSFWDKKPKLFRSFVALLLLIAASAIFFNFFRIISRPTDENLYVEVKEAYYLINPIQVENEKGSSFLLHRGELIESFNGEKAKNFLRLNSIVNNSKAKKIEVNAVVKDGHKKIKAFVDKKYLNQENLKFLDNALHIVDIQDGGASDRAGLQTGDIIVKINGKVFENVEEADLYLRTSKIIQYDILRNNEVKSYEVTVAKYGLSFAFLGLFLASLVFMFAGGFFGLKRPSLKAARLLSLSFILIGLMFGISLEAFRINDFLQIKFVLFITGQCIGIPMLFHSMLYFPNQHNELIKKKYIYIIPYVIGAVLLIFHLINNFLLHFWIGIWILNLFIPFMAIYGVTVRLINDKYFTQQHKRIARAIRITYFITFFLLTYNLLHYIIPQFRYFFGELGISRIITNLGILMSLVPLAYIYTAGRYHLLNISLRIRRNIQYNLISFFLKFLIIIAAMALVFLITGAEFPLPNLHFTGSTIEVLTRPLRPKLQDKWENLMFIIIGLILAFTMYKLLTRFQTKLDKIFYRVKFDYRSATQKIRQMIDSKVNPQEIAAKLGEYLSEIVRVRRIGVLVFRNQNALAAQEYSGFNNDDFKDYLYAIDRKLAEIIKRYSGPIHLDYLPEDIRIVFKQFRFVYIIPIKSKHNLLGAILIGDKLSESAFNNEDFEFLMSISGHAAVAMENAFLYENLAKQERIKHELQIARQIQLASLPQHVPDIFGLDISGVSLPALEVGGDFYDFLNSEANQITIIVGDVSGKGASSAIYMSNAQGIMRTLHEFSLTPKELFIRANRLLYKYLEKKFFITAVAARIQVLDKKIKLARAGHLPLYIYRVETGDIEKITPKGIALGISKGVEFSRNLEEVEINYSAGDIIVFATDGITEARNGMNAEYGEENLFKIIKRTAALNSEEIKNSIIDSVSRFIENEEQFDDMSVVIVKTS